MMSVSLTNEVKQPPSLQLVVIQYATYRDQLPSPSTRENMSIPTQQAVAAKFLLTQLIWKNKSNNPEPVILQIATSILHSNSRLSMTISTLLLFSRQFA